ncbi:hypothetical protein CARUB_v10012509mg [Capsella rubella]|uniref:Uncharacterized protein n=1 Tax=Capsella rubella TaxID=81985 RepID=R0I601_9BRAS|nr:hypothetical protein CARUB_v10012509mg [Capsella rubella]
MGKSSSKAAFIILLALTVEIIEAKRLLPEETALHSSHHKASLTVKPLGLDFCTPPCQELCFGTGCYCVC